MPRGNEGTKSGFPHNVGFGLQLISRGSASAETENAPETLPCPEAWAKTSEMSVGGRVVLVERIEPALYDHDVVQLVE
jgi:hypothetical protein